MLNNAVSSGFRLGLMAHLHLRECIVLPDNIIDALEGKRHVLEGWLLGEL